MNCRKCDHTEDDHPNGFLCKFEGCRCPGFFAVKHPDREDV